MQVRVLKLDPFLGVPRNFDLPHGGLVTEILRLIRRWWCKSLDPDSLHTLGSLDHIELDTFVFLEGLESVAFDCTVVYENVTLALALNKAIALVFIEPFYFATRHF